jgi:hypothetical protein
MEGSGANTNEGCGEGSINKLASLAKVRLIGGRDIGALRTLHNVSHGVTTLVGATQPNDLLLLIRRVVIVSLALEKSRSASADCAGIERRFD